MKLKRGSAPSKEEQNIRKRMQIQQDLERLQNKNRLTASELQQKISLQNQLNNLTSQYFNISRGNS